MRTTKKLETEIQKRKLVDVETGEELELPVITRHITKDKDFDKIFSGILLSVLGEISGKRAKVILHLIERRNIKDNSVIVNQKALSSELRFSRDTIFKALKFAYDKKILLKANGITYVNPDIVFKGNPNRRDVLLRFIKENSDE